MHDDYGLFLISIHILFDEDRSLESVSYANNSSRSVFTKILAISTIAALYEPHFGETGLLGFRPGPTQTGLYSYRRWLEA